MTAPTPAEARAELVRLWASSLATAHVPTEDTYGRSCDERGCGFCNADDHGDIVRTVTMLVERGLNDGPTDAELVEAALDHVVELIELAGLDAPPARVRAPWRPWMPVELDRLAELYEGGTAVDAIGAELGRSRGAILGQVTRLQLHRPAGWPVGRPRKGGE